MLNFKEVELSDINRLGEYLKYQEFRTCDFTAGAIYMWRDYFYSKFAIHKDMLIFKVAYPTRGTSFSYPIGKGSTDEAMKAIEEYTRANGLELKFCTLPEKAMEYVKFRYGDKCHFITSRDWYDYLYNAESLKTFKGKKYHGQRNHVNRFKREYPNHKYHRITQENLGRVVEAFDKYFVPSDDASSSELKEARRAREYLNYFLSFNHLGGFIEVDGEVIAFALGEVVKDTLFVHVERAVTDYHGSYQMIVSEFAKDYATDGVIYINREEDVGDPGLRKSKLSYKPIRLLEKYCAHIELFE